jgi:hypothetical protein
MANERLVESNGKQKAFAFRVACLILIALQAELVHKLIKRGAADA